MAEAKDLKVSEKGLERSYVDGQNVIPVAFGDLPDVDQKRIERELQQEVDELRKMKLACYQKTRGGVVMKEDTASVSATKVKAPVLTPEEVAHFVDISIAGKYGNDLDRVTRVLGEEMHSAIGSFKQDLDNSLPRQMRSVAMEVYGEAQGKHVAIADQMHGQYAPGGQGTTSTGGHGNRVANPNLQLSYFQSVTRGPFDTPNVHLPAQTMIEKATPGGSLGPAQPLQTDRAAGGELTDTVRDQVTRTLCELGFMPRGRARTH